MTNSVSTMNRDTGRHWQVEDLVTASLPLPSLESSALKGNCGTAGRKRRKRCLHYIEHGHIQHSRYGITGTLGICDCDGVYVPVVMFLRHVGASCLAPEDQRSGHMSAVSWRPSVFACVTFTQLPRGVRVRRVLTSPGGRPSYRSTAISEGL